MPDTPRRTIQIQEIREGSSPGPAPTYPSNALPKWLAGVRRIVEDEQFGSMAINMGKVYYRLTIKETSVE